MKLQNIFIFATNIKTKKNKHKIRKILNAHIAITAWSIDQDDIDCVLRIVTDTLTVSQIIALVNFHQYECKELI